MIILDEGCLESIDLVGGLFLLDSRNDRSRLSESGNAKSPFANAFRQADFSGYDKSHGEVSSWEKISMELFAFVSKNSDVSEDTPFSSIERPTTPTTEPMLSESKCQ